jgi:hypothetical protein
MRKSFVRDLHIWINYPRALVTQELRGKMKNEKRMHCMTDDLLVLTMILQTPIYV